MLSRLDLKWHRCVAQARPSEMNVHQSGDQVTTQPQSPKGPSPRTPTMEAAADLSQNGDGTLSLSLSSSSIGYATPEGVAEANLQPECPICLAVRFQRSLDH